MACHLPGHVGKGGGGTTRMKHRETWRTIQLREDWPRPLPVHDTLYVRQTEGLRPKDLSVFHTASPIISSPV